MRRLLACSAVVLIGAAGCSGSDDDDASDTDDGQSSEPAEQPASDAGLSGPGGVITIDGVEYPFEATGCIDLFGDLLTVIDRNGVALPAGAEGSLEFVATCG